MNISTKFHACIRMCMVIVTSRSTISSETYVDFGVKKQLSITSCIKLLYGLIMHFPHDNL